jgi:hypothetical protein
MAAAFNFAEYNAASCTSQSVQSDKSVYWAPQVYGIANGSFTPLPTKTRFYYFVNGNTDNDTVSAFPEGLRLLVGDANSKSAPRVDHTVWECFTTSDIAGRSLTSNTFNFDSTCPGGLKSDITFPSCWDGVNLWLPNSAHVVHPADNFRSGHCPWSHPIKIPTIMLEHTWRPNDWSPSTKLKGNLVLANGDTTGFGYHADFVNAYVQKVMTSDITQAMFADKVIDCLLPSQVGHGRPGGSFANSFVSPRRSYPSTVSPFGFDEKKRGLGTDMRVHVMHPQRHPRMRSFQEDMGQAESREVQAF